MSHPSTTFDSTERHRAESGAEYARRAGLRRMSPTVHTSPAFKEARKSYQGINATRKGSIEKSIKRQMAKKMRTKS